MKTCMVVDDSSVIRKVARRILESMQFEIVEAEDGQVALDKSGNVVGKDDFKAQIQQVFENLKAAVEAAGGSFNDVVKLNSYFVDLSHAPEFREVRDKYINVKNPPASTAVQVSRLFRPEFLIEVEAVAVVPSNSN